MKKVILLGGILLFILGSCSFNTKPKKNISQSIYNLQEQIPIILIHGSGGDEDSFAHFAENIMAQPNSSTQLLNVVIDAKGKLHYQGKLDSNAKRPLISIGYTENNAPIEEWSNGLKQLMIDLKKNYNFQQADVVGYSNGGLAIAYYAETIKEDKNVPKLRRIALLGAPFNDIDTASNLGNADFTDVPIETAELEKYLALQQNLDSQLAVLSIAGEDANDKNTDGVVPLRSALASRLIFPDYVHTYIEKQTTQGDASHANLVNNQQVIDWVYDFLFNAQEKEVPQTQLISVNE
ncbi:alpha/beta hydrolase [Carnobacterium gallinarum]|uniref:alpha/beta hydrolase n=1 Tax=Carnobacterium gallinarum TaxID=2749 RepID=UPI000554E38D|nr:alpha/beta hydrolase [Carnobacterium gallinarum]